MSLLDDVSIVVTPNGYKAGELYAVIPSNGDADMDVTRATAATRVDENGLVNYAEVLGGEEVTCGDFSCAVPLDSWTVGSKWSIGVSGARLVSSTSAASSLVQSNVFEIGKIYKVTLDAVVISGKAKLEGSGGSAQFLIEETKTYTEYFVASKEDFYLNRVSSVSDIYINNVSVKEVTRDNVPRIDYTGGGCPHILAEPQRTNLFTYSSDFSQSFWTKNTVTPTTGFVSPDGTTNAYKLVSTGADGFIHNNYTVSSGTTYTISVYLKTVSDTLDTTISLGSPGFPQNEGTGGRYKNITVTNEWKRYSLTSTADASAVSGMGFGGFSGFSTGEEVLIWGFQLEEGSYPTSYIPTSGSTVTRNQDIFTRDGIGNLINSTEGVLYFEGSTLENGGGSHRIISLSDGTSNNLIYIRIDSTASRFRGFARGSSGSYTIITVNSIPQTDNNKIALVWDATNFRIWINGSERATTIINNSPVGMNALNLADTSGTADPLFGKVKQLQVYTTALTDTQLAALTS